MFLRYRTRTMTKPNLMADQTSQQSSNNQNCAKKSIPSLFGSPKFRDFTIPSEALKSPTSIIDTRMLSPSLFENPFFHDKIKIPNKPFSSKNNIGLALIGNLENDTIDEKNCVEQNKGNVLFGTNLRVKIPTLSPPIFSQRCVEAKKSSNEITGLSRGLCRCVPTSTNSKILSLSEMELCEEYTCVISHGPNPKTTHIFNNCIVEESYCSLPQKFDFDYGNFLRVCFNCKKHLEETNDIFIYRGEKSFCSRECRHRVMVLDGVES